MGKLGRLEKEPQLHDFVKKIIEIRKTYKVFCPEEEMKGADFIGCGVPDVSYHGENAWRVPAEISSRQLGVYYSGEASGTDDCYVIYNMHWLSHTFALPALTGGKSGMSLLLRTVWRSVRTL